jgi:sugar/nucleoside kinase (ribokinase family)
MASPIAIVGNLNVDQIVSTVSRFPNWNEELIVESSHLELAGTAGYLASTARSLGMTPFVVSTVGDDSQAAFLRGEMQAAGIDDSGIVTIPGTSTCLGIIFVGDAGQRAILTVLGAHEQMSVAVAEMFEEQVAACPEVFLCGNYLLPRFSPEHATGYARRLQERGQTVVFDPSWDPGGWPPETQAGTYGLLEYVDIFMPNEEELCHLTGTTNWQDGVSELGFFSGQVIVKRGEHGAVSVTRNEAVEVPGLPTVAVNTIGAGDTFDMSFLYARRQGWDIRRCLDFACAAAAHVISQEGTRVYPDEAGVLAFASRGQQEHR